MGVQVDLRLCYSHIITGLHLSKVSACATSNESFYLGSEVKALTRLLYMCGQ